MQTKANSHFAGLFSCKIFAVQQALPCSLHGRYELPIVITKRRSLNIERNIAMAWHTAILLHFRARQLASRRQACLGLLNRPRSRLVRLPVVRTLEVLWFCKGDIAECKSW